MIFLPLKCSLDIYDFLSTENYFLNPIVNWNNILYFVLT